MASVTARLEECAVRTIRRYTDEKQPPIIRAIAGAYLFTICKNRAAFLRAALENNACREFIESGEGGDNFMQYIIVRIQARWEYEHVDAFGSVSEAMCLGVRYRTCSKFIAVHPLEPDDPFAVSRVPMRHKLTSPWFRAYRRRGELKQQLGNARALVGYARKMTKFEFLEQFSAKPGEKVQLVDKKGRDYWKFRIIPYIPDHKLLEKTGYTAEEFWREVRNPYTQTPKYPQMEFTL